MDQRDNQPSDSSPSTMHPVIVDDTTRARSNYVDDVQIVGHGSPFLVGTEPSALVALALAILSFVLLPVVGAIAALAIAPSAKRKIRESNGRLSGQGYVAAAQAVAIANLVMSAIIIYAIVAFFRWIF